jgi:hypothetical protein
MELIILGGIGFAILLVVVMASGGKSSSTNAHGDGLPLAQNNPRYARRADEYQNGPRDKNRKPIRGVGAGQYGSDEYDSGKVKPGWPWSADDWDINGEIRDAVREARDSSPIFGKGAAFTHSTSGRQSGRGQPDYPQLTDGNTVDAPWRDVTDWSRR